MEFDYHGDKRWIYLFTSMVTSGRLRSMSGDCLKIFIILRTNCEYKNNLAYISQKRMKNLSGFGGDKIKKLIIELSDLGYLDVVPIKNMHAYRLYDLIQFKAEEDDELITARVKYIPLKRIDAINDLRDIEQTGKVAINRGTGTEVSTETESKVIQNFYLVQSGGTVKIDSSTTNNIQDNSIDNSTTINNTDNSNKIIENNFIDVPDGIKTMEDLIQWKKWISTPAGQAIERARLEREKDSR